jgi:hypothetical protein
MQRISNFKDAFESLLDQEASKHEKFVRDGVVDYDIFAQQPIKILWILKETNDKEGYCRDLREFLNVPDSYRRWKQTWLPVLQVSTALLSGTENIDSSNFESVKSRLRMNVREFYLFKRIAAININKLPGDRKITSKELENRYRQFRDLILSQIKLINPDVIICCGVFWVMWDDLESFKIERNELAYKTIPLCNDLVKLKGKIKAHYNPQRIFIETLHPNQRTISHKLYFDSIIDAVKSWLSSKKIA